MIPIPAAILAPFERPFDPVVAEGLEPLDVEDERGDFEDPEPLAVTDGRVERIGRDGVGKKELKGLV